MGRRQRQAIGGYALTGMRNAITTMARRMANIHPLILSHDEVLNLIAPPEHHKILREAAEVAMIERSDADFQIKVPTVTHGIVDVEMCLHTVDDKIAPLRPRFPSYYATPETESVRKKIHEWINWRMEIGREYGIVRFALDTLAAKCRTAEEVRFQFPSVLALCAPSDTEYDAYLQEFHDKVRDFVTPRNSPALTVTERKAIRAAAGYVSAASMLPDEVKNLDEVTPEVSASILGMPDFEFEGETLTRINTY